MGLMPVAPKKAGYGRMLKAEPRRTTTHMPCFVNVDINPLLKVHQNNGQDHVGMGYGRRRCFFCKSHCRWENVPEAWHDFVASPSHPGTSFSWQVLPGKPPVAMRAFHVQNMQAESSLKIDTLVTTTLPCPCHWKKTCPYLAFSK